jgi:peptidoglycan-associated lipoprotein
MVGGGWGRVSLRSPVLQAWTSGVVIVAAALVLALEAGGCARRKGGPGIDGPAGAGGAGFGEQGLAGASSLARARQGLPPEEDGILKDVHFDLDAYTLGPEARAALEQNAAWLKANAGAQVEMEGHADERGTIEYNLALGARRAQAVRDYLTVMGIAPNRLSTISYGEELPVCRDATEQCWQRNRRVHFVILSQ